MSLTQSFEISVSDVNEGPVGLGLEGTDVAENAQGAVIGTLDVTDADVGDSHSYAVSDDRFEVVEGSVKLKDGVSLDHEDAATVDLEVTVTDGGGVSLTQSFEISVSDVPEVSLSTGFNASYFDVDHSLQELDQIDWDSTPTHQEVVGEINYTNGSGSFWEDGSSDTFGAKITGNIEVSESGTYDFFVGADDGVILFIDGVEVVDNDGLHGFRTRSGEIELEPGTHVVEVQYFENYGYAGLKVEWEGPGIDGREVLSAPDVDSLQTVNGMPLTIELKIEEPDSVEGVVQHQIEGLPPGTVVQAGDMVSEADENGAVDITGWDTSVVSITTPLEFTGEVGAQVTTEVTFDNGQIGTSTLEVDFNVSEAEIEVPTVEVLSGFHASYYDVDQSLGEMDDVDWSSDPTHEEVVSDIDYENGSGSFWEGGATDTFGTKITGKMTVEEGGSYDFYLGGDDGAILFIDGVAVIENDGLHAYETRSGGIDLEPGTHEVEVRYFENYGHAGLKLEWEGPDTDGLELVQADTSLEVPENGTLDIQLDVSTANSVSISGLPEDTILVSGDNSAVADGSDIDLSGWNLDLIEIMPPVGFDGEIEATVNVSEEAYNGQVVEAQHAFTISVGNGESEDEVSSSADEMLMVSASDQEFETSGWADAGGIDDSEADPGDDVLNEDIEINQEAEASYDSFETHERQDW